MVVLCHSMSLRDLHISIHVPAWGTTWRFPADEGVDRYFNPRSRVGNDQGFTGAERKDSLISIHVPAWGTTTSDSLLLIFA